MADRVDFEESGLALVPGEMGADGDHAAEYFARFGGAGTFEGEGFARRFEEPVDGGEADFCGF